MSDTAIAFAVVPFLITLTLVLEGVRIGCTRLNRHVRAERAVTRSTSVETRV